MTRRGDGGAYVRDFSPVVLRDDAGAWRPDPLRPGVQIWVEAASRPKKPKRASPGAADCGTPAGFQKHYRANETACDPCREARRVYQSERRAARRKARAM